MLATSGDNIIGMSNDVIKTWLTLGTGEALMYSIYNALNSRVYEVQVQMYI